MDKLILKGHEFESRLLTGTGKFADKNLIAPMLEASKSNIITMALRRINFENPKENILNYIPKGITLLPNTSGARNAEEAIKIARIAREAGCGDFIKIEIINDMKYLMPDNEETVKATKVLAEEGFIVLPYIMPDLITAKKLEEAGAAAVMPLGAPIGSNKGLLTKPLIEMLNDNKRLPIIVDAGIGAPSHAAEAMEMGVDAVLVNTAISTAEDPVMMGKAFAMAVEAGRMAYLAKLAKTSKYANASSPLTDFLFRGEKIMGFYDVVEQWKDFDFEKYFENVSDEDVLESIYKEKLTEYDLLNLLSPRAKNHLEKMARRAQEIKTQYFGNIISLYMPIYISNFCTNNCSYCGFSKKNHIIRKHQNLQEIEDEAKEIAKQGVEHILMLTGEAHGLVTLDYLKDAVKVLKKYFNSVSIEVMPLEEWEYKELVDIGVDGLTVYQETYNEEIYDKVHISGKKKDYHFRLNTPERGAKAGMRVIGIGPLFGLSEIKKEAFMAGLHLKYLTDKYLNSSFAISLPRINPAEGGFQPDHPLDDITFVQFMTAYRLFQVKADINISTREIASFRDHLMHMGITKMSVGSKTDVGGYTEHDPSTCQFEISDNRTAEETIQAIRDNGFQPIFKDWEQIV